jgi:hypothetical protein
MQQIDILTGLFPRLLSEKGPASQLQLTRQGQVRRSKSLDISSLASSSSRNMRLLQFVRHSVVSKR